MYGIKKSQIKLSDSDLISYFWKRPYVNFEALTKYEYKEEK